MSRDLGVEGLHNARDLGGLRRRDGSTTPSGVFFRSEVPDRVTDRGWARLHALGVRTLVDLRQPVERDRIPTAPPRSPASDASGSGGPSAVGFDVVEVDLDNRADAQFWAGYWDNGLVGTALYYLPHLRRMPERAGAALAAAVGARPGGVLLHCLGGRDRTGLVALLLLAAADVDPDAVVDDYLQTVRTADRVAAARGRPNREPELEELCARHGSSTEQAVRDAYAGIDLPDLMDRAGLDADQRHALLTWRGALA
ncbi:MAG: tyrosine-protein phosphatase [Actinobacteria bacterium]|nr:tyrosine-protein phosphatase [Actinomycetota bacterium]